MWTRSMATVGKRLTLLPVPSKVKAQHLRCTGGWYPDGVGMERLPLAMPSLPQRVDYHAQLSNVQGKRSRIRASLTPQRNRVEGYGQPIVSSIPGETFKGFSYDTFSTAFFVLFSNEKGFTQSTEKGSAVNPRTYRGTISAPLSADNIVLPVCSCSNRMGQAGIPC